jgi:polysaccharide chain length determinant protein (PEP-CTERM system associated)
MVRNGELNFEDAKRILRRDWWILPLSIIGCGLIGLVLAFVLPKRYTSQTLVLVDQPTVPADYVKPVVTEDLNRRLASMQEQILSRSRLEPIIDKFGLYAEDRKRTHIEDLVDRLRHQIVITPLEPMPGTQNRQLPGFYVNVTFDNPQLAQQICTEVTSMFLQQNAREREQQASQTTSFLSQQLEEAKAKLDDQDAKLAKFKQQYLGSLPDQEQSNLGLLMGMNTQFEASTQALSRAQQERVIDQSLLEQQISNWKASQTGQNPETLEQQLSLLQDQLTALESRYTPQHPDVIKTKSQIDELKKRMAAAPRTGGATPSQAAVIEPPQVQQLRAKVKQDELNITDLSKRQAAVQEQIRVLQARVQSSPAVEQQYKELTRNYQTALDFYNDLLKKRDQSAMASDLEHEQQSEQFRVLDAPSLPSKPSFPKKPIFGGAGLGAGLVLGLGLMYLLAASDKSMHTERDVEQCLKLPVLAIVPTLDIAGIGSPGETGLLPRPPASARSGARA